MKTTNPPSMLFRSGIIVAMLAGLAVTGLNLTRVKQRITTLQTNLAAQTQARQRAEMELASTQAKLKATSSTLAATRTTLQKTEAEKQEALETAAAQSRRAKELSTTLAKTTQQRDAAQEELARYHGTDMDPEQVLAAGKQIKELSSALAAVQATNKVLLTQLNQLPAKGDGPVLLPSGLRAKVVAYDPKWHFVVLDVGQEQGMLKNAEMLVSRQGKLVGRARVTQVQAARCVASLMPGWELSEVSEGDAAIPAFPKS